MKEIWRFIDGFDNKFQISNYGRVRSLYRLYNNQFGLTHKVNEIKILKPQEYKKYLKIRLVHNGKSRIFRIHRLVAEYFLDKSKFKYYDDNDKSNYINNFEKLVVNHKDENTKNNNVNNLEWCTQQYNNNYGTKLKRIQRKVNQYDLDGNFIKQWDSLKDAELSFGKNNSLICKVCQGKKKRMYGYIWKYSD